VNTKLAAIPCRRAISVTTAPGAGVSSMIRIFAARPTIATLNSAQNFYLLPASTDLKVSHKAPCFVGKLSPNKAAYRGGIRL
jgi:hypothetical protein